MKSEITKGIENRMKLKVNESKSVLRKRCEVVFLGHSFLSLARLELSKKNEERIKTKLRELTRRSPCESLESIIRKLTGAMRRWLNYFRQAEIEKQDETARWMAWQKAGMFRSQAMQKKYRPSQILGQTCGVEERLIRRLGLSGKGWWRLSNSPAAELGMNTKWFDQQGYYSLEKN